MFSGSSNNDKMRDMRYFQNQKEKNQMSPHQIMITHAQANVNRNNVLIGTNNLVYQGGTTSVSQSAKLKSGKSQMANLNAFQVNSYNLQRQQMNTQSRSKIQTTIRHQYTNQGNDNTKSTTSFYSGHKIQQKKWPQQNHRQLVQNQPLKIENSKLFNQR